MPLVFVIASSANAETARVITKENAVREYCKFFAPVKAKVKYNDVLTIKSAEGDWFKVKYKNVEGCIHKSAIDQKEVDVSGASASGKSSATESEVSLAGKGFNPQVEASYKSKHPEANYRAVDAAESYNVPDSKISDFINSGRLNQP